MFDDCDFERALIGALAGIFGATGQTCIAGSRLLVQRGVYDRMVEGLAARAGQIRMGDPRLPETEMGTAANEPQFNKILSFIEAAKGQGARLVAGGGRAEGPGLDKGFFVQPTIFADVRNDMKVAAEEIFGPVLSIIPFDEEEEAVQIANDTPYGLASGVWSQNIDRCMRMMRSDPFGRGLGQHLPRGRAAAAVRRHEGFGLRPRARACRHPRMAPDQDRVHRLFRRQPGPVLDEVLNSGSRRDAERAEDAEMTRLRRSRFQFNCWKETGASAQPTPLRLASSRLCAKQGLSMTYLVADNLATAPAGQRFRALVERPGILRLPGAYNGLSALQAKAAGFEALYLSGAAMTASMGLPDLGVITVDEVCFFIRQIARVSQLPILADGDTGYGEALNVMQMVRKFEEAGAGAVQIEDQLLPKKCGHLNDKKLAPAAGHGGQGRRGPQGPPRPLHRRPHRRPGARGHGRRDRPGQALRRSRGRRDFPRSTERFQ